MHVSHLFWLALILPGYVIVRHVSSEELKSGLLGTLGLCYIAVFGLLTPLSISCYLLELPVWVFSAGCLLIILAAPIELSRRGWWGDLFKLVLAGVCIELLVVLFDMFMGARIGSTFRGDAMVHVGRIRFLLDHGFSNLDPYCSTPYFWPIYHTNILHAFYAAAAQLSGENHMAVWYASLPWGKLVTTAGAYYMVWAVFDRKWPALLVAMYVIALNGPVGFIVYPNKIAPYWLAPYMIGFAVRACLGECSWRAVIKLAAAALILGQVHGLYALYSVGLTAPLLGVMALFGFIRRKQDRWRLAACAFAVCLALPFPAISKLKTAEPDRSAEQSAQKKAAHRERLGGYLHFDNGWLMRDPRTGIGMGGPWMLPVIAVGIVVPMLGRRRRAVACALGIFGAAMAVYYIPPLCAAVLDLVERDWIFARSGFTLRMFYIVFVPGALAYIIEPYTRRWWVRSLLSLATFAVTLFVHEKQKPSDWATYRNRVRQPAEHRHVPLTSYENLRAFYEEHLPPGETVLIKQDIGMNLVMRYDAFLVASLSSSIGVEDLTQRRRDLKAMLSSKTPWPERRRLLRKYDIEYFFPSTSGWKWAEEHTISMKKPGGGGATLIRLDVQ